MHPSFELCRRTDTTVKQFDKIFFCETGVRFFVKVETLTITLIFVNKLLKLLNKQVTTIANKDLEALF